MYRLFMIYSWLFMIIQNDNMNDPQPCSFLIITCSHVSHAIGLFCILAAEVSLECCVCNAGEDIVFRATKVMESSKCSKGFPCKLQTSDVASPGAYNSCIGISDLAQEDGRTGRTAKFKADDWEIIRGLRQKSAKLVEPFTLRYS